MEMPNTIPNTVTQKLLEEKYQIAKQNAFLIIHSSWGQIMKT